MSALVFPTLKAFVLKGREPFITSVAQETLGGKEFVSTWMAAPRWRYTFSVNRLRSEAAYLELQQLSGFWMAHLGRWDSFLFQDPEDYTVTSHAFSIGNGAATDYQLQRTLMRTADLPAVADRIYWPGIGNGYEPVYELHGTPTITGGSSPTYPGNGVVQFGSPPADGTVLYWTGAYYKRCRFAAQGLPMDRVVNQIWKTGDIVIESVVP